MALMKTRCIDSGPGALSTHSPFEIGSKVDLRGTLKAHGAFSRS